MLGIFLDTETNGLDSSIHTPLEIAFTVIDMQNGTHKLSYHSLITINDVLWKRGDQKSLSFTKITKELIQKEGKDQKTVREDILNIFRELTLQREKAVFICQNPSFDRVFFSKIIDVKTQESMLFPYHWLDLASMYWAKQYTSMKSETFSLSKDSIGDFYQVEKEQMPHRAQQGVEHLIRCYEKVVGFPKKDVPKET